MSNASKSEQRANRRKAAKRKDQMRNMIWIGAGALLVAVALILPNIDFTPPEIVDYQMTDFNMIGDPNAPVVVEEYGDYQCSHCRNFHNESEMTLIEDYVYSGKVLFIYHSAGDYFPGSGKAAEANYCAGDQGMFWQYKDLLFDNLAGNFSQARLISDAESIGLDKATFTDCLELGKYADLVSQDYTDFQNSGAAGTPSFLVNGVLAVGGDDYEGLVAAIEAALP